MGQRLGQHFLTNKSILSRIADLIECQPGEALIEIGPGRGGLTTELLRRMKEASLSGNQLYLLEKDNALATQISWEKDFSGAHIIIGDALETLPLLIKGFGTTPYRIVGNIPYYITGYLLRVISQTQPLPLQCVFLIQKDVALRIVAGSNSHNLLSSSVGVWADSKIAFTISPGSFSPPPKVSSAVVVLDTNLKVPPQELPRYFSFVRSLFSHPRKTVINNLVEAGYSRNKIENTIKELSLSSVVRPQVLDVEKIHTLMRLLS